MAFAAIASPLFSQKITGKITSSEGAVEYATVLLYAAADSNLVKGSVTDGAGKYEFENVPAGKYFVNASMVGTGKGASTIFEYNGGDRPLDDIRLEAESRELASAVVVARKPVVEVRADKTILNVEGNLNAGGQTALELLRKAPGVLIDNNENISLKGKNGIRFQIDGRDVPMDSKDLATLLKSMRAEEIAAFEMITNPSAKYDASGNAGIINIRLKKQQGLGTNGSVGFTTTYGYDLKGGMNLRLNNRGKKLNVYGNYGNDFGRWHNTIALVRDQNSNRFDQKSEMVDNNNSHNGRVGADYFINSKHTIGVLGTVSNNVGPWENESKTYITGLDHLGTPDSVLVASNRQPQARANSAFNINYRYADTSGRTLNIDLDRGWYRYRSNSYQPNFYKNVAENVVLSEEIFANNTPTDVDIMTAKADWEQKLWRGKLGFGAKFSHVKTDNTFDFFNVVGGVYEKNLDRSNQFAYDEKVAAGYVNYNFQLNKKWGFQAGLRAENTDWMGLLTSAKPEQPNEPVGREYLSWFPSAAATYTLNQKNQFSLTYSRRIDRPSYRDLNPFQDRLDKLTYKQGNPFLRPQFTNSVELTHTFMGFLNTTVGYSRTNDMFAEYIDLDSMQAGVSYLIQGNLATQDNYSLSLSVPIPGGKVYEGYLSLTGYISRYEANFREGFQYDVTVRAMNLYSEHTIKLKKGLSVQLSGWFNSPSIWQATFRSKAMGAMDVGIQKTLFKGNGTARLSFGDVLHTAGWNSVNDFTPGLYMTGRGTWESRTVRLNFDYRFGNQSVKSARRRQTGMDAENKRIKSGN